MTIFADGQETTLDALRTRKPCQLVCFLAAGEEAKQLDDGGVFSAYREELSQNSATRFESRAGFDYLSLHVPDYDDIMADARRVEIYYAPGKLFFLCDTVCDDGGSLPAITALLGDIRAGGPGGGAPLENGKILYRFFSRLTTNDADRLDDMEEEISALEDTLISKELLEDYTTQISLLRKKLMVLKRYYEGLFDLLEDMEENWNGLLAKADVKALRIQTNRADRLMRTVLNLRDYVTQVREAYQNQLDINLNETMKLFTVITAVFLPLTLIAGWYGMNLRMPEFDFPFTYPVIILFSLLVAGVCLVYFKKKKWF